MSNRIAQVVTPDDLSNEFIVSEIAGVKLNIDNQTITKDSNGVLKAVPTKSFIRGILGENIAGGFLVYNSGGQYYKFNASDINLYDRLVGMTNQTGTAGSEVDIITDGICDQAGGLSAGVVYYAGDGGAVTTTPTSGLRISVGSAISSTEFNVKIKDSIIKLI